MPNLLVNIGRRCQRTSQRVAMPHAPYSSGRRLEEGRLVIHRTTVPRQKLPPEQLVFGHTFTDHMLVCNWSSSHGWDAPVIKPYENLSIPPSASVLHYAIECFEGLKAYADPQGNIRLFRPEMNMKRLQRSAQRLALPEFDESELLKLLKQLIKLDRDWIPRRPGYSLYIRPTIIGTQESLGVAPPSKATLFVICCPVGPYYRTGFNPVSLFAEEHYVRAWPGGTGSHKIGANYAAGILPQVQVTPQGYQQILWLYGPNHEITEVGTMNCFILWRTKEGAKQLVTAPLTDGTILPGVTRDSILALTRGWNEFEVVERSVTMAELTAAVQEGRLIEMFGSGTAAVVSPIKRIHFKGRDLEIPLDPASPESQAGPLTRRILEVISKIQYGEIPHECGHPTAATRMMPNNNLQSPPNRHQSATNSLQLPIEDNLIEFIQERLYSWNSTLNAFRVYFTDLAELERENQIAHSRMAANLAAAVGKICPRGSPPNFVVAHHAWLGPMQKYSVHRLTSSETYANYVRDTAQPALEAIRTGFCKRSDEIQRRLTQCQSNLNETQQRLTECTDQFEAGWRRRVKCAHDPQEIERILANTDVWLVERHLESNLASFLHAKEQFCQQLYELYKSAQELEFDVATRVQKCLQETLLIKRQQLTASVEVLEECVAVVGENDALSEWNAALGRHRLDWEWRLSVPPLDGLMASMLAQVTSALSGQNPMQVTVRPLRVRKSGLLMRPSGTFGRSWSVDFCILSESGFLHFYALESYKKMSRPPFQIPSASQQPSRRTLAELEGDALQFFISNKIVAEPSSSYPILHPDTIILPEATARDQHVFTVTIPAATTFFGRGEKKLTLRSFAEEDMVDWCIAIKELAETDRTRSPAPAREEGDTDSIGMGQAADRVLQLDSSLYAHEPFSSATTLSSSAERSEEGRGVAARAVSLDESIARSSPAPPEDENPW